MADYSVIPGSVDFSPRHLAWPQGQVGYGLRGALSCSLWPFQEAITNLGALPTLGAAGGAARGFCTARHGESHWQPPRFVPHIAAARPWGLWEH